MDPRQMSNMMINTLICFVSTDPSRSIVLEDVFAEQQIRFEHKQFTADDL